MIVISDFYDAEADTQREMRRVVQYGHDVTMLQLISPAEMALPYDGHLELEDLESGVLRLTDVADAAPPYLAAVRDFLDRCRAEALSAGVDYALIPTDSPPEEALREYLLRRGGRADTR